MSRELGWIISIRDVLVREEVMKYPRHSKLADTKFEGNKMNGVMIGCQRKDIFFLSRGDGVHDGFSDAEDTSPGYIA